MLRSAAAFLIGTVMVATPGIAQPKLEATDIANHPFSADFAAGGKLRLRVRSAEVHIIGTAENKISVELSGRGARDSRKLKVRLDRRANTAAMRIRGGSGNGLRITIRIPSDTDLHARIPFGGVNVENVTGNQDIELHAGALNVDVGDPDDYARVDASVFTGELDAAPFGESRAGFFRSFQTTGSGRYRLHAHVGAGELNLR